MKRIFTTLILFLFMSSFAYSEVTVNAVKRIDDDKNWIYITLTVDGDEIKTVSVNPWNQHGPPLEGQALADWCNGREPWFALNIWKQMYEGARFQQSAGDTPLERFETWAVSHTNAAYCKRHPNATQQQCQDKNGTWIPQEVIVKIPYVDSWKLKKIQAGKDMKTSIFYNKTNQQIQNYITSKVTNLTEMQQFIYKVIIELRNFERRTGLE